MTESDTYLKVISIYIFMKMKKFIDYVTTHIIKPSLHLYE